MLSVMFFRMATELANKKAEREALRGVIQQWNANRLDLFELSEPNEVSVASKFRRIIPLPRGSFELCHVPFSSQDLEFHGVMRFYFQDSGQKVATKCIRVASDATSQAVIETLIEKFRPDMRMLSVPEYALYEIHENGGELNHRDHVKEQNRDMTKTAPGLLCNMELCLQKNASLI